MEVKEACGRINSMMFVPGWQPTAREPEWFEGTPNEVIVTFYIPTMNSSNPSADRQYHDATVIAPTLKFDASTVHSEAELYHAVIGLATEVFQHEAREFTRAYPAQPAPLHPHTDEGKRRWADLEAARMVGQIMDLVKLWATS